MGLTNLRNVLGGLDREQLQSRYASGRGQGERELYRPWLTVRELKSRGQSHVVPGTVVDRDHHLFSGNEFKAFLAIERLPGVLDIREQFPLWPIESTEAVAEELGVRHPRVPNTAHNSLMTTDLVVTTDWPDEPVVPVHVKPAGELESRRNQEKLDIEMAWWATRGSKVRVVTDLELPDVLGDNLKLMAECRTVTSETLGPARLEDVQDALLASLARTPRMPAALLAQGVDEALKLDAGVCLAIFWQMVSGGRLRIDLMAKFMPAEPFRILPPLAT